MSDGPHRSLPMRPGWRRVAQCGDNRAFAPEEVCSEIITALEKDCRAELPSDFLDGFCGLCRDQEASLFKDQLAPQLEALRPIAGSGVGRVVLDHAIQFADRGETGLDAGVKAMAAALTDRAARGARQVEEHYCRRSSTPRAVKVRGRIEQGIGNAGAAIEGLARSMLTVGSGPSARLPRHEGLDDGVRL